MLNISGERDGDLNVSPVTDNILYELVCCSEWKEEVEESVTTSSSGSIFSYLSPRTLMGKKPLNTKEAIDWLKNSGPQWQFAVSVDGKLVSVLQGNVLETRSLKDNFATIFGKCPVVKDPLPNLRCMAWSRDSTLLAVSFTNGTIAFYDIMASQLSSVRRYSLPSQEESSSKLFMKENSLVGLFFSSERVKKNSYPNELISVDGKGCIMCYRQTSADQFVLNHESSVRKWYPRGVNAATLVESSGIIIIAGFLELDSSINGQEPSVENGITAWRLINDVPHYKLVFTVDTNDFKMDSRNLWSSALSVLTFKQAPTDAIFKLVSSQCTKYIAGIHVSGTVSIWCLPSLKLHRNWPLKLQFQYHTENPRFNNRWRLVFNRWNNEPVDDWRFFPYDINWWNETVLVVSRVNGCTSLLSLDEEIPTKNLLGDSPEMFESPVPVSPRYGKGFLCMECEIRLKTEERRDANGEIIQNPNISLESLSVNNEGVLKSATQEVLFWLTDNERFRPPRRRRRRQPVWRIAHRLFSLRSITPLELFHQKIDAEEYGEALDLAKVYNLDPDLVYQRQWSRNRVSIHSINDYLRKIKKRNWVLQECLERVPDNIDAARELLQFGLKGTDLSATVMISEGRDKGEFISWTPDDLDISQEEFLLLVDPNNLEVKLVLKYRKQFLYFLDILDTYELMLGGPRMAEENFDEDVYAKLRSRSPAESAMEMARSNDTSGLRIILTHHWEDIEPHYLQVLSSFPETTCPHDYRDFLPEVDRYGGVLLWSDTASKEKDWCETVLQTVDKRKSSISTVYSDSLNVEQITTWYEERIREIERYSGIVSHALDLTRLGIQRNITELAVLQDNLETVEVLVYDVGVDITLEKLEELGYSERLELLMSSATDDAFINHFRKFLVPFLQKWNEKEPGARYYLLDQYLTAVGEKDLKKVLQIMENSKPGTPDPIVPNLAELMKLAYNCIYACKSVHEVDNILAILNCLPERNRGALNDSLKEQHDSIDELELHYQGAKILLKYDVPMTLDQIRQITIDHEFEDKCMDLFKKLCLAGRLRKPHMKVTEWKTMLYDMLELQKKVFSEFPLELCFEIYVADLLKSGSADIINLARDFFDKTSEKQVSDDGSFSRLIRRVSSAYSTSFALYLYQIPYAKGLQMILDAAQNYFDSASSYSDPDIDLAKVCLNLMQDLKEPEIAQMFDLIDAVKILNKDFRLEILPLTVRLTRDKIALVKTAMENMNGGYKKIQQLLKLILFLHPDDISFEDAESLILDMSGSAALVEADMKFCAQVCQNIVAKGYQTGWKIFVQLAKDQSEPPVLDHESKLASINYALNMCPNDEIFNVLNAKCLIEMRSLQSRVAELSPEDESGDLEESFIEEQDDQTMSASATSATTPISLNPLKLHEFISATSKLININPVKGVASAVKSGGDALFQGAKTLLKTSKEQSGWDEDDVDLDELLSSQDTESKNISMSKESYPMVYFSDKELGSPFFHTSNFFFKYDTFSDSSASLYIRSNPSLELCLILDKMWHLERTVLGEEGCGERNFSVTKQLVLEILPEDIPLGLAILLSIKNVEALEIIFADFPLTPLALAIILYSLSMMIQRSYADIDTIYKKNPNQLISETEALIDNGEIKTVAEKNIYELISLFKEYKDKLSDAFS
ncbi:unnamed protein product [Orchesella dallaii]|uniref:Neuroblastoma-amplified sequence n=1 Tax=Orchesella dallaii TaxID=48710 RepID=A0ABP1PJC5_9HEXA